MSQLTSRVLHQHGTGGAGGFEQHQCVQGLEFWPQALPSEPPHGWEPLWAVMTPLTLQTVHMLVIVVLVTTVQIVPITVHQQDGSIPTRPPDPLALPTTKHSWQWGLRPDPCFPPSNLLANLLTVSSFCPYPVRIGPLSLEHLLLKNRQWLPTAPPPSLNHTAVCCTSL